MTRQTRNNWERKCFSSLGSSRSPVSTKRWRSCEDVYLDGRRIPRNSARDIHQICRIFERRETITFGNITPSYKNRHYHKSIKCVNTLPASAHCLRIPFSVNLHDQILSFRNRDSTPSSFLQNLSKRIIFSEYNWLSLNAGNVIL